MSRTLRSGRIAANASVPTTTYAYDANGNVTQAGGWSYVWDYLNRMLAAGYNNSTTTYGYDTTGARVLQTSTTSTAYYPSKFFSLASTTNGGTSWAAGFSRVTTEPYVGYLREGRGRLPVSRYRLPGA